MLMFTLAISSLIRSKLPSFIDITFRVPMQYCSSQHQTLLSPPDTSTTGYSFSFGPASSFFWSYVSALPQMHIRHLPNWKGFQCHIFLPFHTAHGGSWGKNTGMVSRSLLQWTTFGQSSPLWTVHLGWPCMTWLRASLSYARPFTMTRLWFINPWFKELNVVDTLPEEWWTVVHNTI